MRIGVLGHLGYLSIEAYFYLINILTIVIIFVEVVCLIDNW